MSWSHKALPYCSYASIRWTAAHHQHECKYSDLFLKIKLNEEKSE